MDSITKERFEEDYGSPLTDEAWTRVQGLLRRAERELTLLVGDLSKHDSALVEDTLIDAVAEDARNPRRLQSETDDSYSYRRFDMPDGTPGRFWWPRNLLGLFGIEEARGALRVLRVRPSLTGWIG